MANVRDDGRIADMTEAMQAAIASGGGLGGSLNIKVDPASLIPLLTAQTTAILGAVSDVGVTDNAPAFAQVRADIAGIVIPAPVSLAQVNAKLDAIISGLNVTPPPPVNLMPTIGLTSSVLVGTDPGSVLLSATPADADGSITKVEYYDNGAFIGQRVQAPFTFTATGLVSGSHSFTAKAFDNATPAGTATSAASLASISPVVTPPVVTPVPIVTI